DCTHLDCTWLEILCHHLAVDVLLGNDADRLVPSEDNNAPDLFTAHGLCRFCHIGFDADHDRVAFHHLAQRDAGFKPDRVGCLFHESPPKSAWLMITISILSAPSINSMWQWHPPMRPGNRNTVPEGHVRRLQTCVTRNIIKNPCQTLLQAVDDRPGYRPTVQTKRGPYDDIFQDIGE